MQQSKGSEIACLEKNEFLQLQKPDLERFMNIKRASHIRSPTILSATSVLFNLVISPKRFRGYQLFVEINKAVFPTMKPFIISFILITSALASLVVREADTHVCFSSNILFLFSSLQSITKFFSRIFRASVLSKSAASVGEELANMVKRAAHRRIVNKSVNLERHAEDMDRAFPMDGQTDDCVICVGEAGGRGDKD